MATIIKKIKADMSEWKKENKYMWGKVRKTEREREKEKERE